MASKPRPARLRRPTRERWLRAVWGVLALVSVATVVHSAVSEQGRTRLATLFEAGDTTSEPSKGQRDIERLTAEIVRMRSEMRRLALEKQALGIKLSVLEGQLGPPTGSLGTQAIARAATDNATPVVASEPDPPSLEVDYGPLPLEAALAGPGPSEADVHEMLHRLADPAARRLPTEVTRTRFAIELAVGDTMDAVRVLWLELSNAHGELIGGLEPSVAILEQDGRVRLRLLAGPFVNAAEAIELCTMLAARDADCRAVPSEGQKLVMR